LDLGIDEDDGLDWMIKQGGVEERGVQTSDREKEKSGA
jgi:hypothetical protein